LHAYAQTRQPKAAQDFLEQVSTQVVPNAPLEVIPNILTFNSVLAAWAKSGHDEAPEQAERIF